MDSSQAIAAFAALAQTTRLATFRLVVNGEPNGVSAGELARLADVPQNTMSAHLSILARTRLIDGKRSGRSIIYRANFEQLRALTLFLIKAWLRRPIGNLRAARCRTCRSPNASG